MAEMVLADQEAYAATFDVPQVIVATFASALGVEIGVFAPSGNVKKHILAKPSTVQLECTLGELQDSSEDAFVPLLVTKVVGQPVTPERAPN
jgi:hypothetical protein